MDISFSTTKTITSAVVAIFMAIAGVVVTYAPGWLNTSQEAAITTLITVITPVVVAAIGLVHHSNVTAQAKMAVHNTPASRDPAN